MVLLQCALSQVSSTWIWKLTKEQNSSTGFFKEKKNSSFSPTSAIYIYFIYSHKHRESVSRSQVYFIPTGVVSWLPFKGTNTKLISFPLKSVRVTFQARNSIPKWINEWSKIDNLSITPMHLLCYCTAIRIRRHLRFPLGRRRRCHSHLVANDFVLSFILSVLIGE